VCGYTAISESSDPEDVDRMRRQLERVATSVIEKHGGIVTQFYGDGILAVFGFPTPKEDDSRRAIDAALDLHDVIRETEWEAALAPDFELRLHSGVNAGLVFARDGDQRHGTYDVTGDSVNTASRLCSAAERDEIFVSQSALHGVEAYFVTEPGIELTLKGKTFPVPVHRVRGRSEIRTRLEARSLRGLTRFVGREKELAALQAELDRAGRGEGGTRVVVVWGPAGIGKSRLLEEFCARVSSSSVPVLFGCCEGYGEVTPLHPCVQALRHWAGIKSTTPVEEAVRAVQERVTALGAELQPQLPRLLELLSLQPATTPVDVASIEPPAIRALAALFRALSAAPSVLLVLDDWQWADEASRRLFETIIRDSLGSAGCIVLGVRSAEPPVDLVAGAFSLAIAPFDEDECVAVTHAIRPQDLDVGVAHAIHRRSGGNPLFIEELCRSLPGSPLSGEQILESVPTTLQGVIQNRIVALPPTEAATLRAASAFGLEFATELLAEVMGEEEAQLLSTLDVLSRGDLIYATEPGVTFRFKHGVTRDVIYESVRIVERRLLHQAIAAVIERGVETGNLADAIERGMTSGDLVDRSEALAYHYRGSGDRERSAVYAELAGNKALAASALDHAAVQYETALEALAKLKPTPEVKARWLRVASSWAGARVYSPERANLEILERAAAYAKEIGNVGAEANAEYWIGWVLFVLGEYDLANVHNRAALKLGEAVGLDRLCAQIEATIGQSYAAAGNHTEALIHLTTSIDFRRAQGPYTAAMPVPQGFAYALAVRGMSHADMGDFNAADRDLAEAYAIVEGRQHAIEASVQVIHTTIDYYRGLWASCAEVANRSRRICERFQGMYVYAVASIFEAISRLMLGDTKDAATQMRTSMHWLESRGACGFASLCYGAIADALVRIGDLEGARDYGSRALARAERGDHLGESIAYRALARVQLARTGNTKKDRDEFIRQALWASDERHSKRDRALTLLLAAEAATRDNADDEARRLAAEALPELEAMGMTYYVEEARGILGRSLQSS
jgi:class 3 adenylate cyclase/tetratricopeptide (TPR) repeat protein/ABC-type transport system involved in cytochrome c biogenesis ATPase subunit